MKNIKVNAVKKKIKKTLQKLYKSNAEFTDLRTEITSLEEQEQNSLKKTTP